MHIVASSKDLKKVLSKITVCPGNKGAGDMLVMIDTNMEGAVFTRITAVAVMKLQLECDIQEEGKTVCDSAWLSKFINGVEGQVEIRTDKDKLRLSCEEMNVSNPMVDESLTRSDQLPLDEACKPWKIPVGRLFDLIESTMPAMSRDETRGPLMGMCLQKCLGKVWIVGVDGRRFHAIQTQSEEEKNKSIPLESVQAIFKILGDEKRDIKTAFAVDESIVSVVTPTAELRAVIYEDEPPMMDKQLSVEGGDSFKVNKNKLKDTVAVAINYHDKQQIELEFKGDSLLVTGGEKGPDFNSSIKLEEKTKGGHIRVNGSFLLDLLKVAKEEVVELFVNPALGGIGYRKGDTLAFVVGIRTN